MSYTSTTTIIETRYSLYLLSANNSNSGVACGHVSGTGPSRGNGRPLSSCLFPDTISRHFRNRFPWSKIYIVSECCLLYYRSMVKLQSNNHSYKRVKPVTIVEAISNESCWLKRFYAFVQCLNFVCCLVKLSFEKPTKRLVISEKRWFWIYL